MSVEINQARPITAHPARFLALALPVMAANITEPLIGIVDTAAIGRLGDVALLGAVAISAILFEFLFWGLGSLRMSTAGLTAQALGAGDEREIAISLGRALLLALGLGVLLILLQKPIILVAFEIFTPSEAVAAAAAIYITIRIWSAPFALMNYAILGSLVGQGRTGLGLIVQCALNIAKIVLTLIAVAGLEMGIAGAAFATVIAEIFGTLLGLLISARLGAARLDLTRAELFQPTALGRMLAVNRDVAIRTCALLVAFIIFTAQGSKRGDVTLAANAILYQLFLTAAYVLDGFATAAEQMCGQALGGRDREGFKKAARLALRFSLGFGLGLSALLFVAGALFVDFLATHDQVRATAYRFLPFAALTPLLGAAAFAYDGIYAGATWTRAMRDLMLLSLGLFIGMIMLGDQFGDFGLWAAMLLFLATRGIGQALLFQRLTTKSFAS
jgi:multidrug resistance protein, MATE family